MGTTASGIVYPESDDHTRLWEHMQALAESVQEALDERPQVHGQRVTHTATATTTVMIKAITFPAGRFPSTPRVTATAQDSKITGVWVVPSSPTAATLYYRTTALGTFAIDVIAVADDE